MSIVPSPLTEALPRQSIGVKAAELETASIADTLASLRVNAEVGLSEAEVAERRKEYGYNEVAEKKNIPSSDFCASSGESRRGCSN